MKKDRNDTPPYPVILYNRVSKKSTVNLHKVGLREIPQQVRRNSGSPFSRAHALPITLQDARSAHSPYHTPSGENQKRGDAL